ncbi:pre-mRNA-processing factor 17 [Branchiostoma belcheri]|nr:pre-mRNA-processing factor 17 [Branchiostoma belcheri]
MACIVCRSFSTKVLALLLCVLATFHVAVDVHEAWTKFRGSRNLRSDGRKENLAASNDFRDRNVGFVYIDGNSPAGTGRRQLQARREGAPHPDGPARHARSISETVGDIVSPDECCWYNVPLLTTPPLMSFTVGLRRTTRLLPARKPQLIGEKCKSQGAGLCRPWKLSASGIQATRSLVEAIEWRVSLQSTSTVKRSVPPLLDPDCVTDGPLLSLSAPDFRHTALTNMPGPDRDVAPCCDTPRP